MSDQPLFSKVEGTIGNSFQAKITSAEFQKNAPDNPISNPPQPYAINPNAYEITISDNFTNRTEDSFFNIDLGDYNYKIILQGVNWIVAQKNISPFPKFDGTQSETVSQNITAKNFTLTITLINVPFNKQTPNGRSGDKYSITINYAISPAGYIINFSRGKGGNNTNANNNVFAALNDKVLVPILNISGQTLLFGIDIGNVIFTIKDQFSYYCNDVDISKQNNTCEYFVDPEDVKITIFNKCCPRIADVVIGEGTNLYDKLDLLYQQYGEEEIGVPLTVFYPNLFFYAMLKYILARLLYGEFDTKYLLQKYNKRFLKDLRNSRFCGALVFFTECVEGVCVQNYYRYFR